MELPSWLRNRFDKWHLALLLVIGVYAFLLLGLGAVQIQWDEMPHLYGGLLLSRGQLQNYLSFYGYYPPLYDLLTAAAFRLFGVSLVSGRIAATAFALLSMWVVFEFANKTYGPKVALLSSIILGSMPGFYWASRFALLESMLVFFFSLVMFFFFSWLSKKQTKVLILCGLALGLGFLAKYQILIAVVVMIAYILVLCRNEIRFYFAKFPLMLVVALAVVVPWLVVIGFGHLGEILYVIQAGGQDRTLYSGRFPIPVFYLVELTWPYNNTHPIFLPVYVLGLLGLGLFAYRRTREDKFFLAWFITMYLFLTLIPNRQWRYAIPLFTVLAISAASFVLFAYSKAASAWKSAYLNLAKKRAVKVAALVFLFVVGASVFLSYNDGYSWSARYEILVPVKDVTNYAAQHMSPNESILVFCASNSFYEDMVRFYLYADVSTQNKVLQYPQNPIDAFTPTIDMNQVIGLCQQNNVKFVFLYEYGARVPYFNSTLTTQQVYLMLQDSGNFTFQQIFKGGPGASVAVFTFNGAT